MRRILLKLLKRKKPKKTDKHYLANKEMARKMIVSRLTELASASSVSYGRVAIRNQRRRWGSCSSKGNLNFNYKLAYLPICMMDYVIIHELSHLKEFNHGPGFWAEVEKYYPKYLSTISEIKKLEKGSAMSVEKLEIYRQGHSCEYCKLEAKAGLAKS